MSTFTISIYSVELKSRATDQLVSICAVKFVLAVGQFLEHGVNVAGLVKREIQP